MARMAKKEIKTASAILIESVIESDVEELQDELDTTLEPEMKPWWDRFAALANRDKDLALSLVVSYYLQKGFSQKFIADNILGKSEALISRAVATAKHKGWLKYDLSGFPPECRDVLPAFLSETKLAQQLLDRFPSLQRCSVVPGMTSFQQALGLGNGEPPASTGQEKTEEQLLYAAAATRLKTLVQQHPRQKLIVGWGPTIKRVILGLKTQEPISDPHNNNFQDLVLYPFLGNFSLSTRFTHDHGSSITEEQQNLAFQLSIRCSANTNARLLSRALNKVLPPRPLLSIAVLDVPPETCAPVFEADQTLMDLYGRFWDEEDRAGEIWQTDTLITSVGGSAQPETNVYRAVGCAPRIIDQCAADIGGILFDSQGRTLHLENYHLVGPRREHILHLAHRHRQAGSQAVGAGVLVVASGHAKVGPLTVLAQHGFINELITDEQTARGMLAR